jgi:hypothetical protein
MMKNNSKPACSPGAAATPRAICQQQGMEREEEHRTRPCNFIANCIKPSKFSKEINGKALVMQDGEVGNLNNREVIARLTFFRFSSIQARPTISKRRICTLDTIFYILTLSMRVL